jgi:hypothetical protein
MNLVTITAVTPVRNAEEIVRAMLGGFRLHGGHLSGDMAAYAAEVEPLVRRDRLTSLYARLDKLLWSAPDEIKKRANRKHFVTYNTVSGCWHL